MTGGRRFPSAAGLLLIFLFGVLTAQGATQGEDAAKERATELFHWINFAIVAGALGWFFLKLTPPVFRKRADEISSAIAKATAAKVAADTRLRSAVEKLARLEQEVAELGAAAQVEASAEAVRIQALTESEVVKIGAAAKAEIEAAERAARLELKAVAANLAVDGAESLLARQLTPQAQESLVTEFVKNLQERPN
jgi:F-type H+-transporting ATPase subunit b